MSNLKFALIAVAAILEMVACLAPETAGRLIPLGLSLFMGAFLL